VNLDLAIKNECIDSSYNLHWKELHTKKFKGEIIKIVRSSADSAPTSPVNLIVEYESKVPAIPGQKEAPVPRKQKTDEQEQGQEQDPADIGSRGDQESIVDPDSKERSTAAVGNDSADNETELIASSSKETQEASEKSSPSRDPGKAGLPDNDISVHNLREKKRNNEEKTGTKPKKPKVNKGRKGKS
jgi:hypothetical protein